MFYTPILLITFNRPSHTRKVLEVVRAQQPKQLFVFQDGARNNNENDAVKCAEVRQVVKELVDWNCDLNTYYSNVNLGCAACGFPLTAYVKQIGKNVIHLGGADIISIRSKI